MAETTVLDRIRNVFNRGQELTQVEPGPKVEERARPRKTQDTPRGLVFTGGKLDTSSLRSLMQQVEKPKSIAELRAAARLPLVEAIIRTITRDVISCSLDISLATGVASDARSEQVRDQFTKVLNWPKDGETWRTAVSKVVRSSLVTGMVDIELLRRRGGTANEVIKAAREGRLLPGELPDALRKAARTPGDIMGWAVYDSAHIQANIDAHGMYRSPAFYDFGKTVDDKPLHQLDTRDAVASWNKGDFFRLLHSPDTRAERYGRGQSPVEAAWAVIDIIFHLFWRYREDLLNPISKKMVSFEVPITSELSPEQVSGIVETMRADIHAGRLPVLEGVDVTVHDMREMVGQEEFLSPLEQLQVILWTTFGAGLIEMGRVETATRSTAEQQVQQSRRQAVGNVKAMIANELIGTMLADPFSPYGILEVLLLESDLPLNKVELMNTILVPLMKQGLPVGIVIQRYFPEFWALCQQAGITDPLSLAPNENRGRPPKDGGEDSGDEDGDSNGDEEGDNSDGDDGDEDESDDSEDASSDRGNLASILGGGDFLGAVGKLAVGS